MNEEDVKGTIEIKDVKFNYPSKKTVQVLKGVSLKVENCKNRVVALCGTSGCGKSILILVDYHWRSWGLDWLV